MWLFGNNLGCSYLFIIIIRLPRVSRLSWLSCPNCVLFKYNTTLKQHWQVIYMYYKYIWTFIRTYSCTSRHGSGDLPWSMTVCTVHHAQLNPRILTFAEGALPLNNPIFKVLIYSSYQSSHFTIAMCFQGSHETLLN